jgi:hypothetical protein
LSWIKTIMARKSSLISALNDWPYRSLGMLVQTACEALRSGHVLELQYEGYSRLVEVHAVGFTEEDNPIMRVWQISGGIDKKEPVGWKVLRVDEATEAVVTHQKSLAPRPHYQPGDKEMQVITCQL